MSAAAATADAGAAPKKGNKKLIIIIAAVLVLVLAGGGAAVFMMKKKAADAAAAAAEADGEGDAAGDAPAHAAASSDHKAPPTYLPLDPFVVNLADRDADRFAQIGVTLEVEDAKASEELKAYMPSIRNGVLMVLSHKTSQELLDRAGKEALAAEIMRESVRPLGIELPAEEAAASGADHAPKKKKKAAVHNPIHAVVFSSFIIQ